MKKEARDYLQFIHDLANRGLDCWDKEDMDGALYWLRRIAYETDVDGREYVAKALKPLRAALVAMERELRTYDKIRPFYQPGDTAADVLKKMEEAGAYADLKTIRKVIRTLSDS
jgi:hypothetical protein